MRDSGVSFFQKLKSKIKIRKARCHSSFCLFPCGTKILRILVGFSLIHPNQGTGKLDHGRGAGDSDSGHSLTKAYTIECSSVFELQKKQVCKATSGFGAMPSTMGLILSRKK